MNKLDIASVEYIDDCKRIKSVLLNNGYDATLKECEELWGMYSDSMCAGWMDLPDDDQEVFYSISGYI